MTPRRLAILQAIFALTAPAFTAPAFTAPSFAQPPVEPLPDRATLAKRTAARFPQPIRAGLLTGRHLLEPTESQPVLGRVEGIYRQPDGALDMLVRYGGVLGLGTRLIAIPLDGIALLGEHVVAIDYNRAQLDTFPTAVAPSTRLAPDETVRMGIVKPFH